MPAVKTGQTLTCQICGEEFYRRGSYIKRGIRLTCGKPACKSASMSGANNPFWGKNHTEDTLAKIAETKRSRPPAKPGGRKGYQHTPEAKAKMSAALRERWLNNRDAMLASRSRGDHHYYRTLGLEPRYRVNFTAVQKREWKAEKCAYCGDTEGLVLDHIIPVMAGGTNVRTNAQTLCGPCNRWKMVYVDRPFYLATLGSQGG